MMPYESMSYDSAEAISVVMPILLFYLGIIVFALICGITKYILRGIAIYKMSESRNLPNGWLGFIPYAHNYQLGRISGEIELGNKKIKNTGLWLLVLPIVFGCVCVVGYLIAFVPFFIKMFSIGEYAMPNEIMGAMSTFFISMFVLVLIMLVAQVILWLFKYLALHKIFSQYSAGQKPVFYLILSMFVPLAEQILLLMHSNRQTLEDKETAIIPESSGLAE